MQKLPTVTLKRVYHNKAHQIQIAFKYNDTLLDVIRDIPNAKWSKSLKSWNITNTPEHLKLIFKVFKGLAIINAEAIFDSSMPMQKFPKKRIRNLTTANRFLLNNFYKYLKGKRYSLSTIDTYTQQIADFIEYNNQKEISTLTNRDVELFIETVYIKRNYSISTQRQFISALKLFVVYNPNTLINDLELQRPHRSRQLPNVLSQEDILNLIKYTTNIKHKTIITLLYSCGLRISELLNLELNNIDLSRKQVHIKNSKGRKDRMVNIADSFIPLVTNYYSIYKPKKYLFEGDKHGKYSAQSVRQFLKKTVKLLILKIK